MRGHNVCVYGAIKSSLNISVTHSKLKKNKTVTEYIFGMQADRTYAVAM